MRAWESHLDLASFDARPFQGHLDRVKAEGIALTTLAEEKERDPDWLGKIYELHRVLMADVPSPTPFTPLSLEEFRQRVLEHPDILLDGYFLVKRARST